MIINALRRGWTVSEDERQKARKLAQETLADWQASKRAKETAKLLLAELKAKR